MSAWEHLFKVSVDNVGEDRYQVESILCDEYPTMRYSAFSGNKGMKIHRYGKPQKTDISGEFVWPFDPSRESIEDIAKHIRILAWMAAGRYLNVTVQGFIIEDSNGWIHGTEAEYKRLVAEGEFEVKDEWPEEEDE